MRRFVLSLLFCLPLSTGCALSSSLDVENDPPNPPAIPPPATPPDTGCAFVDSPAESGAELLAFVGMELHRFDADGRSTELYQFTGDGTLAAELDDVSFSPGEILAAGDHILVTASWFAIPVGSSQEVVLLHRTDGVVWSRVHEGDDAMYRVGLDDDGFVFGDRNSQGRPADGIWIGAEGSEGTLPGHVVGVPHANRTLLLRQCRDRLGCSERWWRDGSSWDALPNLSGKYRMGDEVVRVIAGEPQELWLESPETQRRVALPGDFNSLLIASFDPAGWALLRLDPDPGTAPERFVRVNLNTGDVDPIADWTGERLSFPVLHARGGVSALFRQDSDVILAHHTPDAGWSIAGGAFPSDYEVVRVASLRNDILLVGHQIPAQFNPEIDLVNSATGARFDVESAVPTQLDQNGLCLAQWVDAEDGAALQVLSLATGDVLSIADGATSQVLWVED